MFEKTKGCKRRWLLFAKSNGQTDLLSRLKKWYIDPESLTPPPGGASGRTEIVLSGRNLMELDGCRGLTVYREDEIAMRIKEGVLSVCGQGLELKIYRGSRIAVIGRIDRLLFLKNEEDRKDGQSKE